VRRGSTLSTASGGEYISLTGSRVQVFDHRTRWPAAAWSDSGHLPKPAGLSAMTVKDLLKGAADLQVTIDERLSTVTVGSPGRYGFPGVHLMLPTPTTTSARATAGALCVTPTANTAAADTVPSAIPRAGSATIRLVPTVGPLPCRTHLGAAGAPASRTAGPATAKINAATVLPGRRRHGRNSERQHLRA
jgi:hypothetical protein